MKKKLLKKSKIVGEFKEGVAAIAVSTIDNYIPDYVEINRISKKAFTLTLREEYLLKLEQDDNIKSIEISKPIKAI